MPVHFSLVKAKLTETKVPYADNPMPEEKNKLEEEVKEE